MAITLVQSLKDRMGIKGIKKIDATTDDQTKTVNPAETDHYLQACAAAVLAAIYKYGRTTVGAEAILNNSHSKWLPEIFGKHDKEAVMRVANLRSHSLERTRTLMEEIADEAVQCIREAVGKDASVATLKAYLAAQRQPILVYLPSDLQMGQILNDDSLDDVTNKMEGPNSTFMHLMAALFSTNSDERSEARDWD